MLQQLMGQSSDAANGDAMNEAVIVRRKRRWRRNRKMQFTV